jgi:uncharacterized protein YuzE
LRRDDIHFSYQTEADAVYIEKRVGDLLLTARDGAIVPYTGTE